MSPRPIGKTLAEKYDLTLRYARGNHLPADAPHPQPTKYWPRENIELLERFQAWLLDGGACEYSTNLIYVPIAGHALGLNLKPHGQIDLDVDLNRALEYARAKGAGLDWQKACRNGLEKFRRFLRLERGLGEVSKKQPFDPDQYTEGLPIWLASELERFQRIQQRNWRTTRLDEGIRRFWSLHLQAWRFFCRERGVSQLADLKRQHILDYIDKRLDEGRPPKTVNHELHTLKGFLFFLQDEGYSIPQSVLRVPSLKEPDPLPKYLTDEQVRLLRDDFGRRVLEAKLSNHRRDALLDRAIFHLLWQCGLRTAEVEDLCMEDLDLGNRKITIRDGKGRKDRTVYVADSAVKVLKEYLVFRGSGSSERVFLYRNALLKKDLIRARMEAAGARTGVKIHPHRLRHTCATQLINAGCRITSIQKYLGHKRLNTTMIYARVLDQTMAEDYFKAMQQIEQQFSNSEVLSRIPSTNHILNLVEMLYNCTLDSAQKKIVLELRLDLLKLEQEQIKQPDSSNKPIEQITKAIYIDDI
jgi:site-specific recombinase XerD